MSRIQLAINVKDVDESVAFYSKLLGVEPAKRRPGYANFAVVEPPLKLVLIENANEAGSLNHLGIEVQTSAEVADAEQRLQDRGLETQPENQVTCCYAKQDKVWTTDPNGAAWEIYTVLEDAETFNRTQANPLTPVCGACC
ncbi:MAG: ArsI/CadI family heavy metal resistance metalloenzyme [Leptolyngbyaceae cyanobacterium MO_188.B28]|nr:ArsI/CadI family heavy metal resistance metalloenzyme [Leptolyngbyaceae cyanobacterium MO_188.B28]